ncbi:MAG: hypothetical protein F6J87_04590 [Spirulina sp. SIO3F2]|nr:hypothetical protein [Spirulina sp. SIO3F2]
MEVLTYKPVVSIKMPYPISDQQLETQVLEMLSLCDTALKQKCDPFGDVPPQIQAIQILHQFHDYPEQVCQLFAQYNGAVQSRIVLLYDLILTSSGCGQCNCPIAHKVCEPREHYFLLISLLQDWQAQCETCQLSSGSQSQVGTNALQLDDVIDHKLAIP